ncbi:MAG: TerC family protein [Herpetosiphonaceae bacterium]|nr:TerC family protein [Herpetosiphonaceae bacterium]
MDWITSPAGWIALVTLVSLEIVLGIDNVIFISIMVAKLPAALQARARSLGLGLAMFTRIALLFSLAWLTRLTAPLLVIAGQELSGRDLILIIGGLFLLGKSAHEIHQKLEGAPEPTRVGSGVSFTSIIVQIVLLDIVFSLDSVITAVGMVSQLGIMVTAVVVAVICMLFFAGTIGAFVERYPTVKMLALSFLLLIGFSLIAEGFEVHIPKGYIYFAMAFSVAVEMLNLRLRKQQDASATPQIPLQREVRGAPLQHDH